nr:hypothetical protein [Tanacetum cinerariifolium]
MAGEKVVLLARNLVKEYHV